MATSATRGSVTWSFSTDLTVGSYANGDQYVVAPSGVTITGTTPAYELSGGTWHRNGTMINPTAGHETVQGFDSTGPQWSEAANRADEWPLLVSAGSSIVTAISSETQYDRPQLTEFQVLTVVSSAPPANSFRPPYVGTDKSLSYTKSDLDYTVLRSLSQPNSGANVPTLSTVEAYFQYPWFEIETSWAAQDLHPTANMPNYGREMAYQLSEGLLSLQLDYSEAEKETLMIRLVQYGIDIYGAAVNGGEWRNNGGHSHGRKAILLLAAYALDDAAMLAYCDAETHFIFGEDQQTFYVSQADVDDCPKLDFRVCYTSDMIGTPEWGAKHSTQPSRDNSDWVTPYRKIVGSTQLGLCLGATLMSGESDWNHPELFDYIDRYWLVEGENASDSVNEIHLFERDMWVAYGPLAPPPPRYYPSNSDAYLL